MAESDNAADLRAALRTEILSWVTPPSGERRGHMQRTHALRLVRALEDPNAPAARHLSAIAEAECARRFLQAGCTLEVETATPSGHHADFRVQRDSTVFFLHIKRLWMGAHADTPPLPPVLRELETERAPVVAAMQWNSGASTAALAHLRDEARAFVRSASIGDELTVQYEGAWVGHCQLTAPVEHGGTRVVATDPRSEEVAVPRAQRLLRRAFGQFMPGHTNVICVVGDDPTSAAALERALLGTVVERWDKFPPRGHRMAHGRGDDGFWTAGRYDGCELVGWLSVRPADTAHVWRREGVLPDAGVEAIFREAIAAPATDA